MLRFYETGDMGVLHTSTITELPYHHHPPSGQHLTVQEFPISQKTILNLLNTKCTESLQNLKQAHALILKTGHFQDHYVAGTLLKCYANPQFGISLSASLQVLEQVWEPNVFVWNCVIKACLDFKQPLKAISMYYKMVVSSSKPNKYTYPTLLKACTIEHAIEEGMQIHGHVVKNGLNGDAHITSAGIQMYASSGFLIEARTMLDSIGKRSDVICCNAMIDGYMKFGEVEAAEDLFGTMNEKTVSSWNTMISGFLGNDMIEEAEEYFNKIPVKDDVSWSAMIDGYNKCGYSREALEVFSRKQREERNIKMGRFIIISVLTACANVGALNQGKWMHAYIRKNKITVDAILGTSLVDMYARCGRLDLAWEVFERIKQKEVFCWNAMIGGLAMHGRGRDAVELFLRMQGGNDHSNNVKPNEITFVALINACAHAGFVHDGLKFFIKMKEKYEIDPTVEHYGCVVNLLGKAGYLEEAKKMISTMPMKANSAVWGALLCACRKHGNAELGERIGEILLDMEPENSGRYTLLSNIYAKAGKWDRAEKVRMLMKERGVKTVVGRSLIELKGTVHEFIAGDHSCDHKMVEDMIQEIRLKGGYRPSTSEVPFDVSEEEKETSLKYHSEKIAIAFGITNTDPGETIRVMKNLRVCGDCHYAAKIVSRVYGREIIVRDRVRYHCFRNGVCSCGDFW